MKLVILSTVGRNLFVLFNSGHEIVKKTKCVGNDALTSLMEKTEKAFMLCCSIFQASLPSVLIPTVRVQGNQERVPTTRRAFLACGKGMDGWIAKQQVSTARGLDN
jgi:hypothetical protein